MAATFSTYNIDASCLCMLDKDNAATVTGNIKDTYGEDRATEDSDPHRGTQAQAVGRQGGATPSRMSRSAGGRGAVTCRW